MLLNAVSTKNIPYPQSSKPSRRRSSVLKGGVLSRLNPKPLHRHSPDLPRRATHLLRPVVRRKSLARPSAFGSAEHCSALLAQPCHRSLMTPNNSWAMFRPLHFHTVGVSDRHSGLSENPLEPLETPENPSQPSGIKMPPRRTPSSSSSSFVLYSIAPIALDSNHHLLESSNHHSSICSRPRP